MKKSILTLLFLAVFSNSFAHYIWIETSSTGKLNNEHKIKIRFGEFSESVIEKVGGENYNNVKDFTIWLIAPDGTKTTLQTIAKDDYYSTSFLPKQKGTYTISLDNKNIKVFDYTKYDYTTFKPQYHAKARVVVGTSITELKSTNPEGIEIIDITPKQHTNADEIILKVLYKGTALKKGEITLFTQGKWSVKEKTNEKGLVTFKLPKKTTYTVEATHEEKTPGTYNNVNYNIIWHCATYCIKN
ncbi:DUF4198 domain-containing protein [Tenacibaculum sp. 1B UA]|uniref:DUF4198 domain-containing protein n=1 Tax=Tenacibaculum sp. 1B UA TaxID=2922252 RepID=UPI002A2432BD|nr:DUF4198 domain-containing protein [Tenacibaculum sp. 1B UA]MDX8552444.1 DUF4198 domain-containing protein [Tenacibaculum sp. 1B UA]